MLIRFINLRLMNVFTGIMIKIRKKKKGCNPFIPLALSSPPTDYSRCELNIDIFAIRQKDNIDHI